MRQNRCQPAPSRRGAYKGTCASSAVEIYQGGVLRVLSLILPPSDAADAVRLNTQAVAATRPKDVGNIGLLWDSLCKAVELGCFAPVIEVQHPKPRPMMLDVAQGTKGLRGMILECFLRNSIVVHHLGNLLNYNSGVAPTAKSYPKSCLVF
jgi:hypothetical protein